MSASRSPVAPPGAPPFHSHDASRSALAAPAVLRLAVVGVLSVVLWAAVWWALAS